MKRAILVVSFGTTFEETRAKNITALERAAAGRFPDCALSGAFTSAIIRERLAARGETVNGVEEALFAIPNKRQTDLFILPTHLLHGEEYDKLCLQAKAQEQLFDRVKIAAPLLACTEDMQTVLTAIADELPTGQGEALILMGHGTRHFCNTVYAAMDYRCKAQGLAHVFVGTVEAYPDLDTVLKAVLAAGYRRALLAPLMLVAGEHAVNDMAGSGPGSWKTAFEAAGVACRVAIKGLGEYAAVRQLYLEHLAACMADMP